MTEQPSNSVHWLEDFCGQSLSLDYLQLSQNCYNFQYVGCLVKAKQQNRKLTNIDGMYTSQSSDSAYRGPDDGIIICQGFIRQIVWV